MDKILILGGTNFIGRNLVNQLKKIPKYSITLFNRGKTNNDLFPNTNKIRGDRETDDLNQIFQYQWDYIIDLSCYFPKSIETIVQEIPSTLKRYIFISTCSVYDNTNYKKILRTESTPLLTCNNQQRVDSSPASYGNRKVACEQALHSAKFPYLIFRPALVYGTFDTTDRFYYWLHQTKTKAQLLMPENGERIFSVTYVHDLVQAIINALQPTAKNGVYNLITNPTTSIKEIIRITESILDTAPKKLMANARFLKEENIAQWSDIPLWLNADYFTYSNESAKKELGFKPSDFETTIKETIHFYEDKNWYSPKFGMTETQRLTLIEKLI